MDQRSGARLGGNFQPPAESTSITRDTQDAQSGRRLGWITADQAVSSLTNLALSILVARAVSVESFGVFALIYASYLFGLELVRALVLDPLVLTLSGDRRRVDAATPAVLGAAVLTGLVIGAGCAAVSAVVPSEMRTGFIVLAVAVPGLLVQDACRAVLLARRRPRATFANDLVWGVTLLGGAAILVGEFEASVASMLALWAGTGWLAACVGLWQTSSLPSMRRSWGWIRDNRERGPYFLLDFLVDSLATYASIIVIGAVAGLQAVGAFNAGRVAMGPVGVLILSAAMVIASEGRRLTTNIVRLQRFVGLVGVAVLLIASVWGVCLALLPGSFGQTLLGDSFTEARSLLIPIGLYWGLRGLSSASRIGLRVIRPGLGAVMLQSGVAVFSLLAVAVGALVAGAVGATWGLVTVMVAAAVAWWAFFASASRQMGNQTVSPSLERERLA